MTKDKKDTPVKEMTEASSRFINPDKTLERMIQVATEDNDLETLTCLCEIREYVNTH